VSTRIRVLSLTLLTALAALAPAVSDARANTLCVGGQHCYTAIQAAVNAAGTGDTIRIAPGTFAGGVTIDRSVSLIGVGASATGPEYPGVTALGGGIEAFAGTNVTIRNSVIADNRAVPDGSVASVVAICPGDVPCPASFGDAAGIDDWGTMTLIGTSVSDNHAAANQSDGGGIVVEAGAALSLTHSAVTRNSASALAPTGRFAAGGGIFVDGGASLTVQDSSIDANTSSVANSIPTPYPDQTGATDQENAEPGGVFLSDGSSATIRNSTLDGNIISVNTPLGQASGADAALCACGDVPLTIANSRIDGNTLSVNAFSSEANGPSGPAAVEADANATITIPTSPAIQPR
jgi:Right handed beta helix region